MTKPEMMLEMVENILARQARSPGLYNGPFSTEGWTIIRDALRAAGGKLNSYTWLTDSELRRWIESSPADIGALAELARRAIKPWPYATFDNQTLTLR